MTVSVVIPTIPSRKALLERAMLSVRNQTYEDIEVVVVDEGRSAPENRTIGLRKATGEFVAFLDDDDFYTDFQKIEKQVALLKDPTVAFVGCGYHDEAIHEDRLPTVRGDIAAHLLESFCNIETSTILIRTALARRASMDMAFQAEQNHDYFYQLSRLGRFEFVPEAMVFKAKDGGQISTNAKKKIQGFLRFHTKNSRDINRLPIKERAKVYCKLPLVLVLFFLSYLLNTQVSIPKKLDQFIKGGTPYV